jgi:hypothetical protein
MAAELVGGTVGLALAHAFEAAYTAQTIARIVNPITASLKKVHEGVSVAVGGVAHTPQEASRAAYDSMLGAQRRDLTEAARRATVVLDPFTGKPDPHPDQPARSHSRQRRQLCPSETAPRPTARSARRNLSAHRRRGT